MRAGHDQPFLHPIVDQLLNLRKRQGTPGTHSPMARQRRQDWLNPQFQGRCAVPLRQVLEQVLHQHNCIHLAQPDRHSSNRHGRCAKRFNQEAEFLQIVAARASWGYGWQIVSPTKWKYFDGSLQPLGTFGHPGAGGVNYWIDRDHELVGAYFEVTTRLSADYNLLWNFDLFQNAITAAIDA